MIGEYDLLILNFIESIFCSIILVVLFGFVFSKLCFMDLSLKLRSSIILIFVSFFLNLFFIIFKPFESDVFNLVLYIYLVLFFLFFCFFIYFYKNYFNFYLVGIIFIGMIYFLIANFILYIFELQIIYLEVLTSILTILFYILLYFLFVDFVIRFNFCNY